MALAIDTPSTSLSGVPPGLGAGGRVGRAAGVSRAEAGAEGSEAEVNWSDALANQLKEEPDPSQTPSTPRAVPPPAAQASAAIAQDQTPDGGAAQAADIAQSIRSLMVQTFNGMRALGVTATPSVAQPSSSSTRQAARGSSTSAPVWRSDVIVHPLEASAFPPSTVMFARWTRAVQSVPGSSAAQNLVAVQKAQRTYTSVLNMDNPMAQARAAINRARQLDPDNALTPQELEEIGLEAA